MLKLKIMTIGLVSILLSSCQSLPVKNGNDIRDVSTVNCNNLAVDYNECRKRLVNCTQNLKDELVFLESVNRQIKRESVLATLKGVAIGGGIVCGITIIGVIGYIVSTVKK